MTTKSAFTPDELYLLWKAPYMTVLAVISAHPGGLASELIASIKATLEARELFHTELIQSILTIEQTDSDAFTEKVTSEARSRGQITTNDVLTMAIRDVRQAIALLRQKAEPAEVEEYQQMILERSDKVANAASEGGFLGIGGVRVSEAEQRVLDEIRLAVNRLH